MKTFHLTHTLVTREIREADVLADTAENALKLAWEDFSVNWDTTGDKTLEENMEVDEVLKGVTKVTPPLPSRIG